jgi:hypothetical protein
MIMKAVITGASSGIGLACSQYLMRCGHSVIGIARTDPPEFEGMYKHRFEFVRMDLADRLNRSILIDAIKQKNNTVDLLVNNAGVFHMEEKYPESFHELIRINLEAVYHLCTGFVEKGMLRSGSSIVNIASVSGIKCEPDSPIYAATKAGVISLTKSFALKWAKFGIRVNAISPGFIGNTNLCEGDAPKELIDTIPMKCEGAPEDIAKMLLELTVSTYMTGANVVIDGGLTC